VKKLFAALFAAGLVLGTAGTASAAKGGADGETGPGDHNKHGLCTAYFNGQKTGWNKDGKPSPGPFADLEDEATANDAETADNEDLATEQQVSDDVFEYCDQFGIGGNPEQNGRFDCRQGEEKDSPARDTDTDGEIECVANGTEPNPDPPVA
jgi:hypothetical protein